MSSAAYAAPGASDPKHRNLLILLFAGFVLSGIATTIVGPMLPVFIRRWSLDDAQAGLFSSVQFIASLAGTLASSALAFWGGYRPALVLGYALMGGGLAGLNASNHMVALEATAAFGLGYGLITPGTNLFVAELGGQKSASLLNQLNFTWGVGAMLCSPLIALALKHNILGSMLIGFGVFGGLLVLGLLATPFAEHHHTDTNTSTGLQPRISLTITIALAALFFIYVATENGIGIWAAEYAKRLAHGITSMTTLAPMFFYAGLSLGRVSAPLVLRRAPEGKIVLGALGLTAASTAWLIASPTLKSALPAVFVAGLGCASIYPIFIAWLSRWYGSRAKKMGGILFALASLGGAAGPGMIGLISKLSGERGLSEVLSLRVGLLAPFIAVVIMFTLVLLLRKQTTA